MRLWMQITREDPIQLVRIRNDIWAYADMSDGFLRLIVIDGDYDHDFFRIAERLLAQGGDFLDAGANFGLLSFGLAGTLKDKVRFHLFEPNPKLTPVIHRSAQRFPNMRLIINQYAVSDSTGAIPLFLDDKQSGASHYDKAGGTQVPCIAIDDYLEIHCISSVPLLKLDVEGYELVALKGAARALSKHVIRAIYFEYFEKWLRRVQPPSELFRFLDAHGYTVCLCRDYDFVNFGTPTHHYRAVASGPSIPLRPIGGGPVPEMTDLIAFPANDISRI